MIDASAPRLASDRLSPDWSPVGQSSCSSRCLGLEIKVPGATMGSADSDAMCVWRMSRVQSPSPFEEVDDNVERFASLQIREDERAIFAHPLCVSVHDAQTRTNQIERRTPFT